MAPATPTPYPCCPTHGHMHHPPCSHFMSRSSSSRGREPRWTAPRPWEDWGAHPTITCPGRGSSGAAHSAQAVLSGTAWGSWRALCWLCRGKGTVVSRTTLHGRLGRSWGHIFLFAHSSAPVPLVPKLRSQTPCLGNCKMGASPIPLLPSHLDRAQDYPLGL